MFFAKITYKYTDPPFSEAEHELLIKAETQEEAEKMVRDDLSRFGAEILKEKYKVAEYVPPHILERMGSEKIVIVVRPNEDLSLL